MKKIASSNKQSRKISLANKIEPQKEINVWKDNTKILGFEQLTGMAQIVGLQSRRLNRRVVALIPRAFEDFLACSR